MHTSCFLKKAQKGTLEFSDTASMLHVHLLRFVSCANTHRTGTLDDCILLGKSFVMKMFDSLNMMFKNLPIFNVAKFFSCWHYFEEIDDRDAQTRILLTC